jgi:hypothetical protein
MAAVTLAAAIFVALGPCGEPEARQVTRVRMELSRSQS